MKGLIDTHLKRDVDITGKATSGLSKAPEQVCVFQNSTIINKLMLSNRYG